MTVLLWAIGSVLALQGVVLAVNIAYWQRRLPPEGGRARLSVLVPARNEIHNLPALLSLLEQQEYRPLEVIVCDDGSSDGTTDWLTENAGRQDVVWFAAAPCPEGWTGKSWACKQLADRARGDWLLFMDADVRPGPLFTARFASWCQGSGAMLVTALPRLRPGGVLDGILTGMVPWSVFSMLPLRHAERNPNPAFAFANGQLMGLAKQTYRSLRPHEQVRSSLLEDVEIARLVKREGGEVFIGDATDVAAVEMYRNLGDALNGFSKNAAAICGGSTRAILFAALMTLMYLFPVAAGVAGWPGAWALVGLAAVLYGASVALLRLPCWYGLLYPVAIGLAVAVMVRSVVWRSRGRITWKGRAYRGLCSR